MKTKFVVAFLVACLFSMNTYAQCAMCRATVETNFSNGKPGIAAGLNVGILYLLSMPYLAIITLGFLWYRSSKANGKKNIHGGLTTR